MHASWMLILGVVAGQYGPVDRQPIRRTTGEQNAPAYSAVREQAPNAGVPPLSSRNITPIRGRRGASEAEELIRGALQLPAGSRFSEIGLRDVLAPQSDRGSRLDAIRSYWKLVERAARNQFAEEELAVLQSIDVQTATAADRSDIADADALAEKLKLQLTLAQLDVATRTGGRRGDDLPFPIDLPISGAYETKYRKMFAGCQAPNRLWRIHQTLPQLQSVLEKRAIAEQFAREALLEARREYQGGRVGASPLIAAVKQLRKQRAAFLEDLLAYNNSIAEYAMNSVGGATSLDRLVTTMIIPRPGTREARALNGGSGGNGVRQASATAPAIGGFRARTRDEATERRRLVIPQ